VAPSAATARAASGPVWTVTPAKLASNASPIRWAVAASSWRPGPNDDTLAAAVPGGAGVAPASPAAFAAAGDAAAISAGISPVSRQWRMPCRIRSLAAVRSACAVVAFERVKRRSVCSASRPGRPRYSAKYCSRNGQPSADHSGPSS